MTKYKDVIGAVQCHYGLEIAAAIAALLAAGGSAYASAQQQKAARRQKRGQLNANGMPQGMAQVTAPTADRFTDQGTSMDQGGGQRLSDMLDKGTGASGIHPMASEKQQGFSLGVQHLGEDVPKQSQEFSLGAQPDSIAKISPAQEQQPPPQTATTADTAGQVGGYAQTAATLYGLYNQLKDANKVQPGPQPKLGPINFDPTAKRFMV